MEPVLRNVTFDVRHKQKMGIVGRTGAGKNVMYQMVKYSFLSNLYLILFH